MLKLLVGIVLLVSGLWLRASHGLPKLWHEVGILNLAFGAFFTFQGILRVRRLGQSNREYHSVQTHLEEASDRMHRGETPGQIAEALERQYHIAPIQSLVFFAQDRLRVIGREGNSADAQASLAWIASDRSAELPPAKDFIKALDPRRNVFGAAGDVHTKAGPEGAGALVASRNYLYFFAYPEQESFLAETAKEAWLHKVPLAHTLNLGKDLALGVKAELTLIGSPSLTRELEKRIELPASFALPWREVTSVGKRSVGAKVPETQLVIRHGDASAPTIRHFTFGNGFNEAVVDDWIDGVRIACVLEGRLLRF